MKLIVGLGNPGPQYQNTRHNIGFVLLDLWAASQGLSFKDNARFKAELAEESVVGHGKIYYLKPQTYMNLSGQSVRGLTQFYKVALEDILIVYDDIDLPLGKIRWAQNGSAGGHNGIKSIIENLGTKDFTRLKIGVGRPKIAQMSVSDYVLENFASTESQLVTDTLQVCKESLQMYLDQGLLACMNEYNGRSLNPF